MEKNKQHLQEEVFVKKYLQEIPLEKTSINFTSTIMDVLLKEEKIKTVKNQPLISKKWWFAVAVFIVGCLYVAFKDSKNSGLEFPSINLGFLQKIQLPNLFNGLSISNSGVYLFGFFTMMIFVQIFFLKNHFEKRYKI